MSDLISREELQMQLNCVDRLQMTIDGRAIEVIPRWNVNKIIENLPSAEPQGKCDGCFYLDSNGATCEFCARNYPDRYSAKTKGEEE